MLTSLLEKAKAATKKWWAWILAGAIAVIVVYVVWKLRRQQSQIAKLQVEVNTLKDQAADFETGAKNASDDREAKMLVAIAESLHARAEELANRLLAYKAEYAKQAKAVEEAKSWQELRKQAKGKK